MFLLLTVNMEQKKDDVILAPTSYDHIKVLDMRLIVLAS